MQMNNAAKKNAGNYQMSQPGDSSQNESLSLLSGHQVRALKHSKQQY